MDKISAKAKQLWAKIRKIPDFSLTFLEFKISLTILQNSLTLKKNKISPTFPQLVATLNPWNITGYHTEIKQWQMYIGTMDRQTDTWISTET